MSAFWAFLRRSRSYWLAIERGTELAPKKLAVVIGNEAADCDSCVSALVWAYVRSTKDTETCVFPIVSCSSKDLVLRREFTLLLTRALELNVGSASSNLSEQLICVDDLKKALPWAVPLCQDGSLSVTLTDHNKLCADLAALDPGVAEIVDHHLDVGAYPRVVGERRAIAYDTKLCRGIGSASTLVAEALLGAEGSPAADGTGAATRPEPSADVALLLLGTILLDTINMSPSAEKATPRDVAAVELLTAVVQAADPAFDRECVPHLLRCAHSTPVKRRLRIPQIPLQDPPGRPGRPGVVALTLDCPGAWARLQGIHGRPGPGRRRRGVCDDRLRHVVHRRARRRFLPPR